MLIVVAAGNDSQDIDKTPSYPASYTNGNLLVVAASTDADGLASYSEIRKTIRSEVDLKPAFSGNTVSGGRLNTNRALIKIGS